MKDGDHLPRVLVVAEEPSIRERAQVALTLHGCAVTTAATGTEALRRAGFADHDLIVLDAVLPDLDGFEVYRRLRAGGDRLPVIFLTATSTSPGPLAVGGDDYLAKPFSAEALAARVLARLGRAGRAAVSAATARSAETADGHLGSTIATLHAGDLELDASRWTVHRAGTQVELAPTEFRLLIYLMSNQGRVLTRGQILENVWGRDEAHQPQIVDTYVSYLRRKLNRLGPPLIHTQRGVGYSLLSPRSAVG
jgi:two-component system OmpR family response regulator